MFTSLRAFLGLCTEISTKLRVDLILINNPMERTFTTYESLIAEYAEAQGFTPYILSRIDAEARLTSSMAAIIRPSTIVEREGKSSGRITSEIDFTLLQCAIFIDPADWSSIVEEMRVIAIEIVNSLLTDGDAITVSDLEISLHESPFTHYDEVALQITAKATSNYNVA